MTRSVSDCFGHAICRPSSPLASLAIAYTARDLWAVRFGDRGPEVQALQQALLSRGYPLPRYGADGDFGRETSVAVERFCAAESITWRLHDDVPPELLDALGLLLGDDTVDDLGDPFVPEQSPTDLGAVTLYDLRHEQSDPHPKSKVGADGRTFRRLPAAIDSIMLHQTGTGLFGPVQGQTGEIAVARRALGVACHAMAFQAGFVTRPVDPLWYVQHGNALNGRSLGLEVEGNYPGLRGRKVLHGEPTELTEETVMAARAGVKLLVEEGRKRGCPIRYIYAHRQADSWRRADPGEELWRRVVLEYAVPDLKLETRPAEKFKHHKGRARDGYPVPKRWDPRGVGSY